MSPPTNWVKLDELGLLVAVDAGITYCHEHIHHLFYPIPYA